MQLRQTFVSVIEVVKFTCQNGVEAIPSPGVTSSPSNETYVDEECKTWCFVRENSIEQSKCTSAHLILVIMIIIKCLVYFRLEWKLPKGLCM